MNQDSPVLRSERTCYAGGRKFMGNQRNVPFNQIGHIAYLLDRLGNPRDLTVSLDERHQSLGRGIDCTQPVGNLPVMAAGLGRQGIKRFADGRNRAEVVHYLMSEDSDKPVPRLCLPDFHFMFYIIESKYFQPFLPSRVRIGHGRFAFHDPQHYFPAFIEERNPCIVILAYGQEFVTEPGTDIVKLPEIHHLLAEKRGSLGIGKHYRPVSIRRHHARCHVLEHLSVKHFLFADSGLFSVEFVLYPVKKPYEKPVRPAACFLQPDHEVVGLKGIEHENQFSQIAEILSVTDCRRQQQCCQGNSSGYIMACKKKHGRSCRENDYGDYAKDGAEPHLTIDCNVSSCCTGSGA